MVFRTQAKLVILTFKLKRQAKLLMLRVTWYPSPDPNKQWKTMCVRYFFKNPEFFITCIKLGIYLHIHYFSPLQFRSGSDLRSHAHLVETQWPSMLGGICTVTRAPLWRRFSMCWHCVSLCGQLKLFSRARRDDRPSTTYRDEPAVQPAENIIMFRTCLVLYLICIIFSHVLKDYKIKHWILTEMS